MINTNLLANNITINKPKSSALRALLDEIKSDNSSRSSSKSPKNKNNIKSNTTNFLDISKPEKNSKLKETKHEPSRTNSIISNRSKDLNFVDMKSEINNLQSKIDGLEKKLCKIFLI